MVAKEHCMVSMNYIRTSFIQVDFLFGTKPLPESMLNSWEETSVKFDLNFKGNPLEKVCKNILSQSQFIKQ